MLSDLIEVPNLANAPGATVVSDRRYAWRRRNSSRRPPPRRADLVRCFHAVYRSTGYVTIGIALFLMEHNISGRRRGSGDLWGIVTIVRADRKRPVVSRRRVRTAIARARCCDGRWAARRSAGLLLWLPAPLRTDAEGVVWRLTRRSRAGADGNVARYGPRPVRRNARAGGDRDARPTAQRQVAVLAAAVDDGSCDGMPCIHRPVVEKIAAEAAAARQEAISRRAEQAQQRA